MNVRELIESLQEALEQNDLSPHDEVMAFCTCRSLSSIDGWCRNGKALQLNVSGALDPSEREGEDDCGCPSCAAEGMHVPGRAVEDKMTPMLARPFTLELAKPEQSVLGYQWLKVLAILPWRLITRERGEAFDPGNWAEARIMTQWVCECPDGVTVIVEDDLLPEIEDGTYTLKKGADDE